MNVQDRLTYIELLELARIVKSPNKEDVYLALSIITKLNFADRNVVFNATTGNIHYHKRYIEDNQYSWEYNLVNIIKGEGWEIDISKLRVDKCEYYCDD